MGSGQYLCLQNSLNWNIYWIEVRRAIRPFIGKNDLNFLLPKSFKCLSRVMGWCGVLLKHTILSIELFFSKMLQCFLQNLVLILLLMDFYTRFIKKAREFYIIRDLPSHHQELRINRFLKNYPLWICSDNFLWQNSVILLVQFLFNRERRLIRPKNHAMRATSKAFQQRSVFLQSLLCHRVGQKVQLLIGFSPV